MLTDTRQAFVADRRIGHSRLKLIYTGKWYAMEVKNIAELSIPPLMTFAGLIESFGQWEP
jgi:hypothetical protein